MKRGLTMVELLVAVGLLSALMLAIASWTQVIARAGTSARPARWELAAKSVLQLIHDDLAGGGSPDKPPRRRNEPPRVEIVDGRLQIRTRSVLPDALVGPVVHRYVLRPSSDELHLAQENGAGKRHTRLLLDRVNKWHCAIDTERQILSVTITSSVDGKVVTRSYLVPCHE